MASTRKAGGVCVKVKTPPPMSKSDEGSSVTLIFYSISNVINEPFLNLLAAAATLSSFTHVELAIGEGVGSSGTIGNVLRIFNDDVGVVSRTPVCAIFPPLRRPLNQRHVRVRFGRS